MFALFPLIMELSKEKAETKKIGPEVEYYYLEMEKVEKKQKTNMDFIHLPAITPSPCCTIVFSLQVCPSSHQCGSVPIIPWSESIWPKSCNSI